MLGHHHSLQSRNLLHFRPRWRRRCWIPALLLVYLAICHLLPAVLHFYFTDLEVPLSSALLPRPINSDHGAYTTNLIVASTAAEDISWTIKLQDYIPDLKVIRYVNDDPNALYKPNVLNKGREALMYFTYLYEAYDSLADINIFVHASARPWHMDDALHRSMVVALSRLDLEQVKVKGYFNLFVSLRGSLPGGYNTSKPHEEAPNLEEAWIAEAFRFSFGDEEMPEMFVGPCCSQFAVTRDIIRRRPREQYKLIMEWLSTTDWPDALTGRVWEHLWPWLFCSRSDDEKVEWQALCRMYGVCFDEEGLAYYQAMWDERERSREDTEFGRELLRPWAARRARERIEQLSLGLEEGAIRAILDGRDWQQREEADWTISSDSGLWT